MPKQGNLTALKLSGSISEGGCAKVYLEYENYSYLIFDSLELNYKNNNQSTLRLTDSQGDHLSPPPAPDSTEVTEPSENKEININLEYNKNTNFDEDDDGVETLTGVIDFTVENSEFNWEPNNENLCTRWQINSLDNDTITTICYGSDSCCNFINLIPTPS